MNICIVNCFDTWECRADLLYDVMREAGNNVKVLCSDFMHRGKTRLSFFYSRAIQKKHIN